MSYYKDKAAQGTSYLGESISKKVEEYPAVSNIKDKGIDALDKTGDIFASITPTIFKVVSSIIDDPI